MKFPVLWSGLCRYTEGWGEKCSEILATIKLLYNPRVNKVFTIKYSQDNKSGKVTFARLPCYLIMSQGLMFFSPSFLSISLRFVHLVFNFWKTYYGI